MTLEQLKGVVRRPLRTIAADGREEEKEEATVNGFVDDWSVEFEGPDALNTGLKKIATFEIASGQRIKFNKQRKYTNGPSSKIDRKRSEGMLISGKG